MGCDDILEAAKAVLSNIDKGTSNIDNDKNFKILLTNLRKLKTKGSIAPWCSAINQYMEYSKVDVDLNELQKSILKQSDFVGKRGKQLNRAIKAVGKSLEDAEDSEAKEEDEDGPTIMCLLVAKDGIASIDAGIEDSFCCDFRLSIFGFSILSIIR